MDKDSSSTAATQSTNVKKIVWLALGLTLVVAYQLYVTAQQTGNWEGFWFSLVHTVIVAVGAVLALRW
jgi:hypothetical protein